MNKNAQNNAYAGRDDTHQPEHVHYGRHTEPKQRILPSPGTGTTSFNVLVRHQQYGDYCLDMVEVTITNPINAPKIAPDQGLPVIPQVLPAHLPK